MKISTAFFYRDGIKKTVTTRIDLEHFLAKISNVSKAEEFTNAVKSTQVYNTIHILTGFVLYREIESRRS